MAARRAVVADLKSAPSADLQRPGQAAEAVALAWLEHQVEPSVGQVVGVPNGPEQRAEAQADPGSRRPAAAAVALERRWDEERPETQKQWGPPGRGTPDREAAAEDQRHRGPDGRSEP